MGRPSGFSAVWSINGGTAPRSTTLDTLEAEFIADLPAFLAS